jgi:hypothetical protein
VIRDLTFLVGKAKATLIANFRAVAKIGRIKDRLGSAQARSRGPEAVGQKPWARSRGPEAVGQKLWARTCGHDCSGDGELQALLPAC